MKGLDFNDCKNILNSKEQKYSDEQATAGFSLRYQEEQLLKYCKIKGIEVLKVFSEDYSEKKFNRPAYREMFQFAKKNKKQLNHLLFGKWDSVFTKRY